MSVVLDIGEDVGALVRRPGGRTFHAAVYPALRAGVWRTWSDDPALPDRVTIAGGAVTELDWRA
jgi:hypothetical protein